MASIISETVTEETAKPKWQTPEEIMKKARWLQKKRALQARINRPQRTIVRTPIKKSEPVQKRKNPFAKTGEGAAKKIRTEFTPSEETSEDTIFKLINDSENRPETTLQEKHNVEHGTESYFNSFLQNVPQQQEVEEEKGFPVLPMDWSLKTRMRLLTEEPLIGPTLKTSQEASGLTSFVRCTSSGKNPRSGLDISPGARFHQATYYWQHPHLPWMSLFPRTVKSNPGDVLSDTQQSLMATEWSESLRSLYQLVRARQCPYFYVCSNTFTAMFRAAGVGGQEETHVYMTPTTRGMREALKKEQIEFKMPMKVEKKRSSLNTSKDKSMETSSSSADLTKTESEKTVDDEEDADDDDEEEDLNENDWLISMGVEEGVIRKMNSQQTRKIQTTECHDDFSAQSLILIDDNGNCQAFLNFLLNCKTLTTHVGKMSGVPPTLLAPVAFSGAVMKSLQVRQTKIQMDSVSYNSVELKGAIMPHLVRYLCDLAKESRETFSATLATYMLSEPFNRAELNVLKEKNKDANSDHVFSRENLSNCGVSEETLAAMCRVSNSDNVISHLERVRYNKSLGGFMWS